MIQKIACILLLLSIIACSTIKIPELYTEPTNSDVITQKNIDDDKNIKTRLYEIKTTDTLISVARKYNTTPQVLISLNNLKKPYALTAGLLIRVPIYNLDDISEPREQRMVHISPGK